MGFDTLASEPDFEAHLEKQVNARIGSLLSTPMLLAVYNEYGWEPFRRSSVLYGLYEFLDKNDIRGKRCLEIGSWHGLTALVLSYFFEEVVSIDIYPSEMKRKIAKKYGQGEITFIDISDNREKAEKIREVKFDCAYMDGDHAKDTFSDWELVKKCGRVIFDEVWEAQAPVRKLVKSLDQKKVIYGPFRLAYWNYNLK